MTSTYSYGRATKHQASCIAHAAEHSDRYIRPQFLLQYKEFSITCLINRTAFRIVLCCSTFLAECYF
jgi:hypothetical protein